ncbi:hypothetical protein ONE63_004830 [Megalurothrips usitatus]|uniref:Translational activator of cytochrome c oxidase 1 n=1 Tax=Megalurothrips usitatus TaxID=439358 RepID=A0AAV7X1P9_9NEOP|nr:hypothetical protein ONE63_004830 [Megalurothrips usitatus]
MFSRRFLREIRCVSSNWGQVKRNAGHSKWANIRHTKAAKDSEKSLFYSRKLRDIRVALAGSGWNTDVNKNPLLARAIEGALAASVPKDTLESYLQKVQKVRETPIEYRLRGPHDCIVLISYSVTAVNESELRYQVKKLLQKSTLFSITTGFTQAFEKKGIILAKNLSKESSMDDAEEAAIIGGAEEVKPEGDADDNVYRFMTEPNSLWTVVKHLRSNNWAIEDANIEDLPAFLVEIPEAELEDLAAELEKFQKFPEFLKSVDNIA